MIKRAVALVALSALICGFSVSCGNSTDRISIGDATVDTAEIVGAEGPALGLPENLNYAGNTVTVLNCEGIIHGSGDDEADVTMKAKYYQELAVEDRLGVEIEFIDDPDYQNMNSKIRASVNSDSDDYQMVFNVGSMQNSLIMEGLYIPLEELPYIDLEKTWWNTGYMTSVSLNSNKPHMLVGDISYSIIDRTAVTFVNTTMLEELHGITADDMYGIVLDGQWTFDKLCELTNGVYHDTNGNTVKDQGDRFGYISWNNIAFNWMAFSSGLSFTTRDSDGYPIVNAYSEKAVDVAEILCNLYFNNGDTFIMSDNHEHIWEFNRGNSLFLSNRFFLASWEQLRTMEDDFAIIPNPKYDESVDGYYCTVEPFVQWGCVPVTVKDAEMVSAVAEAMAYEGYNKVTPAYYETSLKLKYTRGDADQASRIIDLIREGARTDFLMINNPGNLGNIYPWVYQDRQNTYASRYASFEMAGMTILNEMIESDKAK